MMSLSMREHDTPNKDNTIQYNPLENHYYTHYNIIEHKLASVLHDNILMCEYRPHHDYLL